ncbi:unnamed protein product [Pleuronectes platessa]|uniref:Uncharacterized protein n=1 Tax=Pleuronectes platessa TaxID=8262 RepID=A0A9N7THP9_PLEPL|nr:unnamed protein product [Pleuronectes platessa]
MPEPASCVLHPSPFPPTAARVPTLPRAFFPRTDHLLPTCLPASSLPWILPQPSVFDHEFRLFPPDYVPALLCGYTAQHWTCLPASLSSLLSAVEMLLSQHTTKRMADATIVMKGLQERPLQLK